jgi:hypothetical protein
VTRSVAIGLALVLLATIPAVGQNAARTFVGTIAFLNLDRSPPQFGVRGRSGSGTSSATHTFFIDSDFQGVYTSKTGTKKKLSDLKVGTQVQVTFREAHLFGSNRAAKVTIVNGFAIPMAQPTGSAP